MEYTVAESTDPPVAALIRYGFIPWACDIDLSDEWTLYATGLSAFPLPMICIIDPANMVTSLDRSIGLQSQQSFYKRLLTQARATTGNPRISSVSMTNGVATILVDSLAFGATVSLEKCTELTNQTTWTTTTNFVSSTKRITLVDLPNAISATVFYRICSSQ